MPFECWVLLGLDLRFYKVLNVRFCEVLQNAKLRFAYLTMIYQITGFNRYFLNLSKHINIPKFGGILH